MERIMCSVSKTHGIIVPDISKSTGSILQTWDAGSSQKATGLPHPRLAGCASALPQLARPWPSDPDAAFCPDATKRERASA